MMRTFAIMVGLAVLLGAWAQVHATEVAQATASPTADILPTPPPMPTSLSHPPTQARQTATSGPTTTPTPEADERPDACEPNNSRDQACPIPIDAISGPFTFVPSGDQEYYRADLGTASGLVTEIIVRQVGGLDLMTTISRDDSTLLAAYNSPAISTTLVADVAGPIVLRIENRDPSLASGRSYNIEIRRVLPPTPTPAASRLSQPTLTPDIGENNWSPATAAPIGIGVVYDLNFTCPVNWSGACEGGDFDYFRVPVKKGGMYLICTFDLGPGVDTVLELYWGREDVALTGNDDIGPIGTASVIRWIAPGNGEAIVRIGPRTGGLKPLIDDRQANFYRFAVALAGSPLAQQLEQRIAEQNMRPTPTRRAADAPSAGGGSSGGNGAGPGGGNPSRPSPLPQAPPAQPTSMPIATPIDTGEPQPIAGVQVVPMDEATTPTATTIPRTSVPILVRTGYDRNQNKVLDPDEGIRGLMVYVTDSRGQLVGQGMTDTSGKFQMTVHVLAQDQLTVTIPYFAAARVVSAQQPYIDPILISQVAAVPGLLP